MTTWASRDAVEAAAAEWSDAVVQCRIYGHNWRPLTVFLRARVYTVRQRCNRCRNEREQTMDSQGYTLGGWRMTYRDGYLMPAKSGRVDGNGRAALRITSLRALNVVEVEEE